MTTTTLGAILKIKKYLIASGVFAFTVVYLGFFYLVFFTKNTEIKTHLGTISFGSGTALGWFITLSIGIVFLLGGWLHGKYQTHQLDNPKKYL
jgi:hypothetical protein